MAINESNCVLSLQKVAELVGNSDDLLKQMYGLDTETMSKLLVAIDDPKKANAFLNQSLLAKTEGVLYEFTVNFLIGGLSSTLVNMGGNGFTYSAEFVKTALRTASAIGTSGPMSQRAATELATMRDQWLGMASTLVDVGKMTGRRGGKWRDMTDVPWDLFGVPDYVVGTRTGTLADDAAAATGSEARRAAAAKVTKNIGRKRSIASDNFGFRADTKGGQLVDVVGSAVNATGEFMRQQDLFAKTLNYRLKIVQLSRTRAERIAKSAGGDVKEIYSALEKTPHMDDVIAAAQLANSNTFTNELGSFANAARTFLQKPGLRLFTPFFRTLVNVTKYGLKESPIGEVGKAIDAWRGGDSYFKTMVKQGPEGDAARSQLAYVAIGTYAASQYFGSATIEDDGYGFTGWLDTSNPNVRQRARDIAPAFSYRTKDGEVYDFSQIEPIRTYIALQMSYQQLATFDVERLDPETGKVIPVAQQAFDIMTTVSSNLFGDYFAVETFNTLSDLTSALTNPNGTDRKQVEKLIEEITRNFAAGPGWLKDVNSAGVMLEEAYDVDEAKRRFSKELRISTDLMDSLRNRYFNPTEGIQRTTWGDEKLAKSGLTMMMQSSLFTRGVQPDAVDYYLSEAGAAITFLDNPKKVNVPGMGTNLDLSPKQIDDFMLMNGKGGDIPELNMTMPTKKQFIKDVMYAPGFKELPPREQYKILNAAVALRENAFIGVLILRNPELYTTLEKQLTLKAELQAGIRSTSVPLDWNYVKGLFGQVSNLGNL